HGRSDSVQHDVPAVPFPLAGLTVRLVWETAAVGRRHTTGRQQPGGKTLGSSHRSGLGRGARVGARLGSGDGVLRRVGSEFDELPSPLKLEFAAAKLHLKAKRLAGRVGKTATDLSAQR